MKNKSKDVKFSEYLKENYPVSNQGLSNRKPIDGVGINDADYTTQPKIDERFHVTCPAYSTWQNMIKRGYSVKLKTRNPTYMDIQVCKDWLKFSNFREWYIKNHRDGHQLDKDLLIPNNKIYSPETCIFIPSWLNSFTLDSGKSRGKYVIGVYWHKQSDKFIAQCSNPITNKREYLGSFNNESSAYAAWLLRKLEIALELKPEMDAIDLRIYYNVVEIIRSKQ